MRFTVTIDHSQNTPIVKLKDTITQTEAEIYSFGGLLNAFNIQLNNKTFNCIEGFNSVADVQQNITNGFKSAKIAPFVCRLKNGEYNFNITDSTTSSGLTIVLPNSSVDFFDKVQLSISQEEINV